MTDDHLDIEYFREKLNEEMQRLIEELQSIGRINPDNPGDWEAVAADLDEPPSADLNEEADDVEAFGENVAVLDQLETRFNEVKGALERIEEGTYGRCRECEAQIESERLEANPAAETCTAHLNHE